MARKFHLGDILSITTGRLVSPRHVDGLYDILNYMTSDNLFTHQLPRAMDECRPWLLRQHPDLAAIVVGEFTGDASVLAWLDDQIARYGKTRRVEPIPADDHARRDPLTELVEMVGPAKIIPVVVEEG